MKITAEKLEVLKAQAEQVMLSGKYPARFDVYIPTATRKRAIYDRFDKDGTVAAILTGMMVAVEKGLDPVLAVTTSEIGGMSTMPAADNTTDKFTEKELAAVDKAPLDVMDMQAPSKAVKKRPGAAAQQANPETQADGAPNAQTA